MYRRPSGVAYNRIETVCQLLIYFLSHDILRLKWWCGCKGMHRGILSPEVVLGYTSFANTSINARKIVGHMIKTSLTSRGVSKNQNPRESPKSSKNLAKSNKSNIYCKLLFILRKNTTIVVICIELNTFQAFYIY